MKNVLVTMSGGTTQVINATLAGIIDRWHDIMKSKVYAGIPGIQGFLTDSIKDICISLDGYYTSDPWTQPGSAIIGTTRIDPLGRIEFEKFEEQLIKYNIGYFINIGGNGTLKQTMNISEHFKDKLKCASAAKTIDNDLGDKEFIQSFFTPGFQSVVNYWKNKVLMLDNENRGAYTHDKVLVAQTFGRETGFIAGAARLADTNRSAIPLLILLPEDQRKPLEVLNAISNMIIKKGRCIVVISEGYEINKFEECKDKSGQTMYGSSSSTACQELVNLCMNHGIQARLYNPTVEQRQDTQYRLPSELLVANKVGKIIVDAFHIGLSDFFASVHKLVGANTIPFDTIYNNYSRTMLTEWISYGNFDVTDSYVEYLTDVLKYRV